MPYSIHHYELAATNSLNARSTRHAFPGVLIREERGGVGCLHPWPELGDLPLTDQLELLASGNPNHQTRCALECARIDGEARQAGRSLFEGLTIPRSHFSAASNSIEAPGFDRVKLKVSGDAAETQDRIVPWLTQRVTLRLDFNLTASPEQLTALRDSLGEDWSKIELIEDPFPDDPGGEWSVWQDRLGVAFAADRIQCPAAKWQVYKPAIDRKRPTRSAAFTTSYMDHAIGQLWAAYCAALTTPEQTCGLLTHSLFEPDPFFDRLRIEDTRLVPPGGTGLGYDELLDDLPWTPLA